VSLHPIRLVVDDDLKRWRVSVFFRLLFAIPHFFWLGIWAIGAFFAAIGSWFATLVKGTPPLTLHNFLAGFVRYATHVYAYITLAANPFPGFLGHAGTYPIDVEIEPPGRQNRWGVAFRLVLALPALVLTSAMLGLPTGGADPNADGSSAAAVTVIGTVSVVSFLAWFACLVRGEMPLGFRNLLAFSLRYAAQSYGYLFLLTARYPDADPAEPPSWGPDHPVTLTVADDLRRSRFTVLFRLLLGIPHYIWFVLWTTVALVVIFVNWFAVLITGRTPRPFHQFLAAWIRYSIHLYAFLTLVGNPFPGFTGTPGSYPIDLELPEPERQPRLVTLFRLFLAIPALLVNSALSTLLFLAAFFGWFYALATGRMPRGMREVGAYALRYQGQLDAYFYLLTARYPYSGPTLGPPPEPLPLPLLGL
jgi:hypothetical protein